MLLDDEAVNERLNSDRNLANRFGRKRVDTALPQREEECQPEASDTPLESERAGERADERIPDNELPDKILDTPENVNEIILHRPGNNRKHIHPTVRETIAVLSRAGEPQTKIAEQFGVSDYEVHALKEGKITRGMNQDLVEKRLEEVRDVAITKMMQSMGLMTNEKMSKVGVKDLSSIAANMSRVVEKSLPKQVDNGGGISITIYAPEQRKESSYDSVEI